MFISKTSLALYVVILTTFPTLCFAKFSDVSNDHQNAKAINFAESEKIVEGYEDGTFNPDGKVNRAEFLKIIVTYANRGDRASRIDMCFTKWNGYLDVPRDAWYARYFCRANDDHLISGYPDGTFQPDKFINFAEAAKILVVADASLSIEESFKKAQKENKSWPSEVEYRELPISGSGPWYEPFVRYLATYKAIPLDIQSFDQQITRGQMVEMLYRLSQDFQGKSLTYEIIGENSWFSDFDVCAEMPTKITTNNPITYGYPKKKEYSHLGFLGEILTAAECGSDRLVTVYGDLNQNAPDDVEIQLSKTSEELYNHLITIGFVCRNQKKVECFPWGSTTYCQTENFPDCLSWTNDKGTSDSVKPSDISLEELLSLKKYLTNIEHFNCFNCLIREAINK